MIILLLSALSSSLGVIIDKIVLSRRHLSVHIMAPLQFLFLFLVAAIIVPWIGRFDISQALAPKPLVLFLTMVLLAGAWNVLYYRGIKNESLQEFELVILLTPLVTTILSALILQSEHNTHVLIAALVASSALLIAHIEKKHFEFDNYSKWLLLAVVLAALESIVIKELLHIWSPAALYMARTFYVFLFFSFVARPSFGHLSPKSILWVLASAVAGVIFMVTKFYGYQSLGIIYSTLVLALEPAFTLILNKVFLREPIKPKYVMAIAVIIAAIIYGTITK